jgi:hypothetical protein
MRWVIESARKRGETSMPRKLAGELLDAAESRGGARNLSFEGIRCTLKGAYKVFAYGAAGRFTPVDGADWQPIPVLGEDRYRQDLWRYHFCVPRGFQPRPRKDMLRSLRGRVAPNQPTGFQAD